MIRFKTLCSHAWSARYIAQDNALKKIEIRKPYLRFSFFVPSPLRSLLREAGFDRRELDALDFWLLLLLAAGFEDLLGAACSRLPDFCPLVDCFRPGEDFAFDTPRGLSASGLCRRDDRVWVVVVELPRLTVTGIREEEFSLEELKLEELKEVTAGVSDSFFFSLVLGRVEGLCFTRGVEVGHIFGLGDCYSQKMGATILGKDGKAIHPKMGCYGIGVSRIVAAAIEQNHDERGILWPATMAPFHIALIPIQMHKSYRVREACEKLYRELLDAGYEVLFDDRKERPGVMFANMDLIGIPYQIVVGERGLDDGTVEFKSRSGENADALPLDKVLSELKKRINIEKIK